MPKPFLNEIYEEFKRDSKQTDHNLDAFYDTMNDAIDTIMEIAVTDRNKCQEYLNLILNDQQSISDFGKNVIEPHMKFAAKNNPQFTLLLIELLKLKRMLKGAPDLFKDFHRHNLSIDIGKELAQKCVKHVADNIEQAYDSKNSNRRKISMT